VLSERTGLLLRGTVVAVEVVLASRLYRLPSVPGAHRRLYWLALAFVPLGPLAAAALPDFRVPLMHLSFIGGFSMLVFAVSFHVVFQHTGNEALSGSRPWPVALVGILALLATAARASAEQFDNRYYFEVLGVASSLWLAGSLIWGTVLMRLVATPAARAGSFGSRDR
jgi:uncharacterized protein involved in response to NO